MTAPAEAITIVLARTDVDILNVPKDANKLIAHEALLVVNA